MPKNTFKTILVVFSIIIMLLPIFAALNGFLTGVLDNAGWYRPVQQFIVPWQARIVAGVIRPFGINSKVTPGSSLSTFYMIKKETAIPVDLSWNCLGWQSILLLIVSLITGLRGPFTHLSRIKCVLFGLVGTLLINILRMSVIALGIYYINALAAQIIHDYLAAFFTIIWLFIFWWFSYRYILEEKESHDTGNDNMEVTPKG